MARLWLTYREGLRLVGNVVANIPVQEAVPRLDVAPWRLFSLTPPDEVSLERVRSSARRKRVLLEIRDEDRAEFCGLPVGFFDSPFPLEECLRRLGVRESP